MRDNILQNLLELNWFQICVLGIILLLHSKTCLFINQIQDDNYDYDKNNNIKLNR